MGESELDCVIQVARSLGILDEVNKMRVVPGASPCPSLTSKNVRYIEVNRLVVTFSSEYRVQF